MKHASPLLQELWTEQRTMSRYEAFIDLVNRAARRERGVLVGEAMITLQRGELLVSERDLAERWQWTRHAVRALLADLKGAGELLTTRIARLADGSTTKLTLTSFDTYASPATKGNQGDNQPKSLPAEELASSTNQSVNQAPPTPPVAVITPTATPTSRPLQRGVGSGVARARNVENPTAPTTPHDRDDSPQLEIPEASNPEHLRFAEELADALNYGQGENGRVDRDSYRPVAAHHRGTLLAALAIKNAGVDITFATQYVRVEGQRYKPRANVPQIASLAYLEKGCIADWRRFAAKRLAEAERARAQEAERDRPRSTLLRTGDLLAGVLLQIGVK